MNIASNIKYRRLELKMSQKELADATGYKNRSAIAKIEAGENDLPVGKIEAFARALDTTPEKLILGNNLGNAHTDQRVLPNAVQLASTHTTRDYRTSVIIAAAGKSSRNQQNIPNQFINVLGKPILMHSVLAYEQHNLIDDIYIVCTKGWEQIVGDYLERFDIHKCRAIIPGGETGLLSIKEGFNVLTAQTETKPTDYVIVQEANRPFVSQDTISSLLNSAFKFGDCVVSESLQDHLPFFQNANGTTSYLDRAKLYSMQSPDVHTVASMTEMFARAEEQKIPLDENCTGMLLHKLGMPLHFCEGDHNNIKIVRAEDIAVFTALLKQQG